MKWLAAGFALIGWCASAVHLSAADDAPAIVLILDFENSTGRAELDAPARTIPDLIAAFLVGGTDRVQVVDRTALEEIYREKSLSWQGLVAGDEERRQGVLARAGFILRGSVVRQRSGRGEIGPIELQVFLHETASTRLLKSFKAEGSSSDFVDLCRQVAAEVAGHFRAELPPIEALAPESDPRKSLVLIHGLSAFHNGRFHRAMTCFLKILEDHPEDETATFWLARSFASAGLERHAEIELKSFLSQFPTSERAEEVERMLEALQAKGTKK